MASQELWMGYSRDGGRAALEIGGPGSQVLLLGSRAGDLAGLVAVSAKESGWPPVILDLSGALARCMSGYFDTYDYRSFLYDSFRLEEPGAWHSQLAAAAYTQAMDLSSEEEAIINAAMQAVSSDGTLLSPHSLQDVMGKVEGFRGFYVDKLKGKIGALRLFDAVEDQTFARLTQGNIIVDFHPAPYPLAAELAAALFLAKFLAVARSRGAAGGFLLVTDSHRVFRASPRPVHSNRLLTHLLEWPGVTVLSTGQQPLLSPLVLQACPVRVYSSDAWHSQPRQVDRVLPGTFVMHDGRTERNQTFVQRRIPVKTAEYAPGKSGRYPGPDLAARILEEVDRYPLTTPESLVQYIAPEFLPADAAASLASLERQGCLVLEPKESGSGPRVFCYTLTEKGKTLLEELRG